MSSWKLPCRDAALHRREDRKRKRDEDKAAEKENEKLKKIKEETEKEAEEAAKEEPAALQNGTRGDGAKEDGLGQAQVKTEHIKKEPASAAASEADLDPPGDKVRQWCVGEAVKQTLTCKSRSCLPY